jgi:peptidoglycan/LPS O-acetylase OafA/YrhL
LAPANEGRDDPWISKRQRLSRDTLVAFAQPTASAPPNTSVTSTVSSNVIPSPAYGIGASEHRRLPSLDGWRALSIVLVLGAHSTQTAGFPLSMEQLFSWIFSGSIGVRFFFVISGFLITWILLRESKVTGRIHLPRFYRRRAFRILPVYLVFLATLAAAACFTPFRQTLGSWLGNLTFSTNFVGAEWPAAHLWTLAVEEQFYFLWPPLLLLCRGSRTIWFVLAAPLLLAPCFRTTGYLHSYPTALAPLFYGSSFFLHFDALAIGCAFAKMLSMPRGAGFFTALSRHPTAFCAAAIAGIGATHVCSRLYIGGQLLVPFGPTLQAVAFAVLLVQSIQRPEWGPYRLLNQPVVMYLGTLSYSLYIWQEIFCTQPAVFGSAGAWWFAFPTWLAAVFIVAVISHHVLEQPMIRFGARQRLAPRVLATA